MRSTLQTVYDVQIMPAMGCRDYRFDDFSFNPLGVKAHAHVPTSEQLVCVWRRWGVAGGLVYVYVCVCVCERETHRERERERCLCA